MVGQHKGTWGSLALLLLLLSSGCLGSELPPEPTAAMVVENTNGVTNSPIKFNGSFSNDDRYPIVSYLWNFGDGEGATGPEVTHSYRTPGVYYVRLVVINSQGGGDRVVKQIVISRPNTPPLAVAGPDQTTSIGKTVTFNGGGSSDQEGAIVSYNWSFGDGGWEEGQVVTHVYDEPDLYVVKLTVTDEDNVTDSDSLILNVERRKFRVTWDVFRLAKVDSDNYLSEGQREDRIEQLTFDNLSMVFANVTWTDELDSGTPDLVDPDSFNLTVTGQSSFAEQETADDGDLRFFFAMAPVPAPIEIDAMDLAEVYSSLTEWGHWSTVGNGEWRVTVIMEDAPPDNPLPPPAPDLDSGNDYHLDFDFIYYKAHITEV